MYSAFLFTLGIPLGDKSPGKALDLVAKKPWNFFSFFLLATLIQSMTEQDGSQVKLSSGTLTTPELRNLNMSFIMDIAILSL